MLALPLVIILAVFPSQAPTSAKGPPQTSDKILADAKPPKVEDGIGIWLVNLARHQGHLVGRGDPRSASLHVLAILEAATQADPTCAEAYYWLYDLQNRMGRADAAKAALEQYVRLTPQDISASIRALELELGQRQTAEKRVEFVESELQKKGLPPAYESELHRWLAKHAYERGDTEPGSKEIETALRLDPMNVPARRLAYEMFGETEPALQRVEMALQLIAINPSQVNLVWDLAEFLDHLSLHRQAQEWYNRAMELHRRGETGPIPAEFWHKLAVSYTSSEDFAKAKQACDEALKIDGSLHLARLLRSHAEIKLGDAAAAKADQEFVLKAYEARIPLVTKDKLADEAAQIAWFFCYHVPDKSKALDLAKIAMDASEPSSLAKLAYGYALRLNGKVDEAVAVLQPLAAGDQLAALELARARIEMNDKPGAITILHKAAALQYSGIAYNLIREMLTQNGETASAPPLNTKVIAALDKFQRDVFDYYKRPQDFLKFTLKFASDPIPSTGPINIVFRLENAGPFIITFGEGFMARPLVAVSAKLLARETAEYKNYLQVMMNNRPHLLPGEALEKTVAVDVGPIRERLIATATQPAQIEVSAMFDPVFLDGQLKAGLGTVNAAPIKAARTALGTSPEAVTAIADQARSGDVAGRCAAADALGALLAAAPSEEAKLPVADLRGAMAKLLADSDWRVRGHALVACGWSKLDNSLTKSAAPAVRDENIVAKLLALRLFAAQHGDKFREVLQHLSRSDPNSSVRLMASSYLPETTAATSGK